MLTINEITAVMPPDEKENSTMTTESTGLFQGLAPLLFNRTVIMTVSADGKGLLTLNVIPKKVKDDESDALTTPLCITASPEERLTTLNGTSPGAETCGGADQLRSWKRCRAAAKAVALMVPLCPMESVAPALMRSLTWWL